MVDFLLAFYFRRVVREVLVDGEGEAEGAVLVHALVRVDVQDEVEDVVWVGEFGAHGVAEGELGDVCMSTLVLANVEEGRLMASPSSSYLSVLVVGRL